MFRQVVDRHHGVMQIPIVISIKFKKYLFLFIFFRNFSHAKILTYLNAMKMKEKLLQHYFWPNKI